MRKRIAIDINEVLRDYLRQFANIYKKFVNSEFDLSYEEMDDFNLSNIFPFYDSEGNLDFTLYNDFKYTDYAFEIYARAEAMSRTLPSEFNLWTQNTMRNFDDDNLPEIVLFSPFEMNLSIQSTLSFLARFGIRLREIHFPLDSMEMWEKCDIMITANPNLLNATPEGKVSFKVNAPYNKEAKGTYEFNSMSDIINDTNNTLINLIEND